MKSVSDLLAEVRAGESTLLDGPVRRVEVVSLRVRRGGLWLTEVRQVLRDGSERTRAAPPSEKRKPGETVAETAARCVREELGREATAVDAASVSTREKHEVSPSYPGLPSHYRLHTVDVEVPDLPDGAFSTEETGDSAVVVHVWEWRKP
ncbi:NUDIX domain-containing protein [Streptomyces sp. NPDC090106]|uniref:NUDIX domain-containing protein n=1 Tax=Streptomyces sp. NPDC090106 TaxID=3365946 RepID=UPI0037F76E41